ncbi:MAG: HAD family phosphatase [Gammaproteobacteria bacterium]|nr:HAD family phosphatase [Gammaproteobacteria bacterium]
MAAVSPQHEVELRTQQIFKDMPWRALNRGDITEEELIDVCHKNFSMTREQAQNLMQAIRDSLIPVPGGQELLHDLHAAGYNVYALTDNTHNILAYLKQRYDFWSKFKGIVSSADVRHLKPSAQMYETLINTYKIIPEESVFLDDLEHNIAGAKLHGIHGVQFFTAEQASEDLRKLFLVMC